MGQSWGYVRRQAGASVGQPMGQGGSCHGALGGYTKHGGSKLGVAEGRIRRRTNQMCVMAGRLEGLDIGVRVELGFWVLEFLLYCLSGWLCSCT